MPTIAARPVADRQILRGVAAMLSWQPTGADGEPAAPAGAVTIGITKADGTTVVAAGTATTGTGSSPRTYALAAMNTLELLTVTWTDTGDGSTHAQLVEVVGGFWFSVADARAADRNLTDTTIYSTERILAVRAEVEAELESMPPNGTGQAWVPRYRREAVRGTGLQDLIVGEVQVRAVRSVTAYEADGSVASVFTPAELAELVPSAWGTIRRSRGNVWSTSYLYVVEYEHGHDRPPADLRTAAVRMLRHRLNSHASGVPDRAESFVNDAGGRFVISTPGVRGAITGIPEVDVAIKRHRFNRYGIA